MPQQLFPALGHDHGSCAEKAIAWAREICDRKGIRLTPLREAVLRILTGSHRALGAYEIIDLMQAQGRRLAPISVYRIIDVLLDAGLVHRLESKNAYFACLSRHEENAGRVVLLCDSCHRVAEAEAPDAWGAINSLTRETGFSVSATVLEVQGQCSDCRKLPSHAA